MNLKKLLASAAKIVAPVAKAAIPAIIGALVTHQSVKAAVIAAARDEVLKRGVGPSYFVGENAPYIVGSSSPWSVS